MAPNEDTELSATELDVLQTVDEGHSLVIERTVDQSSESVAHVIMSVAYDEDDNALAEVVVVPLDLAEQLIERGFLNRSEDGPVLDEHSWYDEELGAEVVAEEFLLSETGDRAVAAARPEDEAG